MHQVIWSHSFTPFAFGACVTFPQTGWARKKETSTPLFSSQFHILTEMGNVYVLVHLISIKCLIPLLKRPDIREKEHIWLSPMTKAPTPTENSRKQSDSTTTPLKTSITKRLRIDLGRSVGVMTVTLQSSDVVKPARICSGSSLFACLHVNPVHMH